jgi:putative endonuclease
MYFVYILISQKDGTFYKGYTSDYQKRLDEHNAGLSKFTSTKLPWQLFYVECHSTKQEAMIREKKLKRCNTSYYRWLSEQTTNLLKK